MTTECFDCLTQENYAAVARELQQTALQAESCIFELERTLRAAANKPTYIRTGTAVLNVATGLITDLRNQTTANTFTNSSPSNPFFTPLPKGVWQLGLFIQAVATGAVTDNSYRFVYWVKRDISAPTIDIHIAVESQFEPNVGTGVHMCLVTSTVLTGNQLVVPRFLHNNTGSSMDVQVGSIYWATRLSDEISLKAV